MRRLFRRALIVCLLPLLAGIGTIVKAQERMTIQANAMGTSTELGKTYNVNITIEQFSTPDDRKALIDAFKRSGQDGACECPRGHETQRAHQIRQWGRG